MVGMIWWWWAGGDDMMLFLQFRVEEASADPDQREICLVLFEYEKGENSPFIH